MADRENDDMVRDKAFFAEEVLTMEEVAKVMKVTKQMVSNYVADGIIAPFKEIKFGGRVMGLFVKTDVLASKEASINKAKEFYKNHITMGLAKEVMKKNPSEFDTALEVKELEPVLHKGNFYLDINEFSKLTKKFGADLSELITSKHVLYVLEEYEIDKSVKDFANENNISPVYSFNCDKNNAMYKSSDIEEAFRKLGIE